MKLQSPEPIKLARSAMIVIVALALMLGAKYIFTDFDWIQVESVMLSLFGAWLVNVVKEATGL
jgi:hypothetical protein